MSINAITLIVEQPSTIARRLHDAFGWTITQDFGAFAELATGNGAVVWLNVPSDATTALQQGVVVHCWVEDVRSAADRARAAGATILREPAAMDYGMESARAQVQDGPIVDLTRPL